MSDTTTQSVLSLSELRRRLGRSQAEVATAANTTQSSISRIEHQTDIHVSTLVDYVAALGYQLRLFAENSGNQIEIAIPSLRHQHPDQRREFRVIWQDQISRDLVHVGWLEYTGDEFKFSYVDEAKDHERFQLFPAFPRFGETYKSTELFPFFSIRLINAADPRYDALLDALGLTRDDATPVELLARSPDFQHDTIQVVPEPKETPDGVLEHLFLVSGTRHADENNPDTVSRIIESLPKGAHLDLIPEPDNEHNPLAIHLSTNGRRIGWIPNYLLSEIHGYINSNSSVSVTIFRANGPDAPPHLRLLCRMTVTPGPIRIEQ